MFFFVPEILSTSINLLPKVAGLTPRTMVSVDTADGLGWLLFASAQAGSHQGGHGTTTAAMVEIEKCIWRLILLVFCV
jgi:hypothetical protein